MIARLWHGRTNATDATRYRQYVTETGIQEYLAVKGNLGAQIWQKQEGDITHIWTLSWWEDLESIQGFAGKDYEKARYFPEDRKFLLEFEPSVGHYQVFDFRPTA
jgi:hypothetical protein